MSPKQPPIDLPERGIESEDTVLELVGPSTLLAHIGGFTVLAETPAPMCGPSATLGDRCPSVGAQARPSEVAALPRLDLILLASHQGQRFDESAAQARRGDVPVIATRRTCGKLHRRGLPDARALADWEAQLIRRGRSSVKITSLPSQRSPRALEVVLGPGVGWLLEFRGLDRPPLNLYLTGDPLVQERLQVIARRYSSLHLVSIGLGRPSGAAALLLTMEPTPQMALA